MPTLPNWPQTEKKSNITLQNTVVYEVSKIVKNLATVNPANGIRDWNQENK